MAITLSFQYRRRKIWIDSLAACFTRFCLASFGMENTQAFSVPPSYRRSTPPSSVGRASLLAGHVVEFVTDIEGNWEYLSSLVDRSPILDFDSNGSISLAPDSMLVHGGDAPDKGPGDIRVVKALVQLKRAYPDRVFLLCGNRDINKLRFASELDENETGMSTADIYWNKSVVSYQDYLESKVLSDGAVSKLKWMLECTMGCPTTFETRRMELAYLKGDDVSSISDDDVLRSFRESVDPKGSDPWMLEYLRSSQLMAIIGDCVFAHGAIVKDSLGKVPGEESSDRSLKEWCEALNRFAAESVADYERKPQWDTERQRGGELLMNYGVPNGFGGSTVVYNTYMDNGNCAKPDETVVNYLADAGVRRVFTGHQPTGDCPSVVSVHGLTIFMCDTSYSDVNADKTDNPSNNRGKAVSNVLIRSECTTVTGVLASGESHGFELKVGGVQSLPDSLIGRELLDGSWVKTVVDGQVLVARGEGWNVYTKHMTIEDALSQVKKPIPES